MKNIRPMSRRAFVASAASAGVIAAGGLSVAGASEKQSSAADTAEATELPSFLAKPDPISDADISQTYDADVVVVGLGVAGTAAARAAAESGLKVVAIERSSNVNCRSSQFAVFNSDNARAMGVNDIDTVELVNELMIQMGHRPNFKTLKRWADNCGEAFDWYANGLDGIVWRHPGDDAPADQDQVFVDSMLFDPYQPGVDHEKIFSGTLQFEPKGQTPVLQATFDRANATGNLTAIFDTRAVQLTKDGERVSGVIAQSIADQSYIKAMARKAVVLATGGFLDNDEMMNYYLPWVEQEKQKYVFTYNSVDMNNDKVDMGDGHRMGFWAGGHIEAGPQACMTHGSLGSLGPDAFLQLNAHGERFCNEDLTSDHFGTIVVRQPQGVTYQLFDADWPDQIAVMQGGLGTVHKATDDLKASIDDWTFAKGDTIEELVANMGVDANVAETMKQQIDRYNELCEKGKDEDFGKAPERMFPLVKPPFYAIRFQAGDPEGGRAALRALVTLSGLSANENAQVLNDDFDVVPGLYAVGNVQGGRFLGGYPTTIAGMSHSIALTYGYLTGKFIAENE